MNPLAAMLKSMRNICDSCKSKMSQLSQHGALQTVWEIYDLNHHLIAFKVIALKNMTAKYMIAISKYLLNI